jgi:hypothetical protein
MKPRVRWVSVAVVSMLAVASACLGAESGYYARRGGIGGQLGVSTFRLDRTLGQSWFGDYSDGAKNRFAFSAQFRYVVSPHLRLQVSPGLAWAGYMGDVPVPMRDVRFPDDRYKGAWLTVMVPVSVQGQAVFRRGDWLYHVGAGPGLYRVWVQNHREVVKDPVTFRLHRGLYLGGSGQLGVERFLKELNSTSIEMTLASHLALAVRDDRFVSGLNSNVLAVELRIGANYYFDTGGKKKKSPEEPVSPPKP